jgi:hypothetical protein
MRVTYGILLTCPSTAPLYDSCLQHIADLSQFCTCIWRLPATPCWTIPALHLYMRVTCNTLLTYPCFAPLYEGYLQHVADLSQLCTSIWGLPVNHVADLSQLCTSIWGLPATHCWPIPALHLYMRVTCNTADLSQLCPSIWGLPATCCWPIPALHLQSKQCMLSTEVN